MPEDDVRCESFTVISINFLLVYQNKYYLQLYLDNCAYKVVNMEMIDYLDVLTILTIFLSLTKISFLNDVL